MDSIVAFLMSLDPSSLGVGGIIGALVAHWLAKWRSKKDRVASASKELRAAFSDELSELKNTMDNPYDILKTAYKRHEKAVSEFSNYLGRVRKRRFLNAWEVYRCHPENPGVLYLEQYSKVLGDVHLADKNRGIAIERINQLLSFAKHT